VKLETVGVISMKATNLTAKSGPSPARPVPAASKLAGATPRQVIAGEERRRSQRVLLRTRANIHVGLKGATQSFEVTTLSVNSHGAVVVMEKNLPVDSQLVLENAATKERIGCRVTRPPREMPEGYHVPVEFDSPAPNFWGIAFPPSDWRPIEDI
jgi:hypothetical protein